jgi:hypothetical protein
MVVLVAAALAAPTDTLELDAQPHHLGVAGQPEWDEFAADPPEGRSLELRFEAEANRTEATLLIRQRDVKLDWDVLINNKKVGRLLPVEAAAVHALALPRGTLRAGENTLVIGPAAQADDIVIEEVRLDPRPLRESLGGATLEVVVSDSETHDRLPGRITIVDERGALAPLHVNANSRLAARAGVVYTSDGQARIAVPPGKYTIYGSRGFEYGLARRTITLQPQGEVRVDLPIRREVPTPGLVACDTHIHTLTHSGHGDASLEERVVTLAGEGVELPIATDHEHLTDLGPAAERLEVAAHFTPVIGDEVTTKAGHFNAFPFPAGTRPPDPSITDWTRLLRTIRAGDDGRVVVLNHPRDLHAGFRPFDEEQFNSVTGAHQRVAALGVDAIEVINSGALQSDVMQLFRDWMALRHRGERLTAVAGSDSHDVARYIVGQGRTYVVCPDGNPSKIDIAEACRSLREGRALVSLGLLVNMTVDERFAVGDLATRLGRQFKVTVRVLGPSWVEADRLELYLNGVKVREQVISLSSGHVEKLLVEWDLPRPVHDAWLFAVASGPGVTLPHWAIPRPYQPTSTTWHPRVLGATNAIEIDADGDGRWTSPRAYAQEVVKRVGTEPADVIAALATYDEAVAAQAAELCEAAGTDPGGPEFIGALASAPEPVRRGFAAYVSIRRP